jgi:tol-pal system protein YbgF
MNTEGRRSMSAHSMSRLSASARALVLAAGLVTGIGAQAGLFDDDEARKAILDIRTRITQNDEQARAKIAELSASNAQMLEQIQQIRRNLVDLNTQNESLRQEVARLTGQNEQLTRDVTDIQRRQKDIAQGVDDRMKRFEPQTTVVDGKEFVADPEEKRAYDEAMALLRGGDFEKASAALDGFTRRYSKSGYIDSARFWLGNAQYGRKQYAQSIATFRQFISTAPDHQRAPEAMLAMANSQIEVKDRTAARRTLNDLVKNYPSSEAAQAGRERLAALK